MISDKATLEWDPLDRNYPKKRLFTSSQMSEPRPVPRGDDNTENTDGGFPKGYEISTVGEWHRPVRRTIR